jgi:hypothetical protein
MSRTYRLKKHDDKYLEDYNSVLTEWIWTDRRYLLKVQKDPNSKEAKQRIAMFHSDSKKYFWDYRGPGWFHNITQRSYRTLVRKEIYKFLKDEEYEIQLRRKPHREYWT